MALPAPTVPLCLGGNVFGWTADEAASHAILDAFTEAGGTYVDTADGYSAWVDGHQGGESETVIGRWLARSGRRDDVVLATKVSAMPARKGLAADNIWLACEDSLARLGTDHLDLYYAHFDDPGTPLEETLGAFDALVEEGKVLHVGLSNYEPERLAAALEAAERHGFAKPVALQPEYSLVERGYEESRRPIAEEHGLAVLPYYALASGFLSGKYRPEDAGGDGSPRAGRAARYLQSDRGPRVLEALDAVAAETGAPVPAIALAWLAAQPTVLAPIASARTTDQLAELLRPAELDAGQLERLSAAAGRATRG